MSHAGFGSISWINQATCAWIIFYVEFRDVAMIGSYRLPTHRRGAHRKFLLLFLLILKSEFWPYVSKS